MGKEGRRFHW